MTRDSSVDPTGDGHRSKSQAARQGASETGQRLSQAGGGLAHSAADRSRDIAGEAARQGQQLLGQASDQLKQQAGDQQHRAANGLRALGEELRTMSGSTDQPGVAKDLVRHAADRANQAAQWLDQREPGMVLNDVRDYARRNPGLFLAGAAVLGVLAGRLTRSRDALQGGADRSSPDGMRDQPDGMRGQPQTGPPNPGTLADAEAALQGARTGDGQAQGVRR